MTSRVLDVQKTHIVYIFYQEDERKDTQDFFHEMKIKDVPTIVIFNRGKEVRRHTGIVPADTVSAGVKTSKQQEESWYPDWLRLW